MRKFRVSRRVPVASRAALLLLAASLTALGACTLRTSSHLDRPRVVAIETFLADITGAVAGPYLQVDALMPPGADPHAFEVTPADVRRVAQSSLLIANGAGFDALLLTQLISAAGEVKVVEAAAGLPLQPAPSPSETGAASAGALPPTGDPHLWLDPLNVVHYVENIRAALTQLDPPHAVEFAANATHFTDQLVALDEWIRLQVQEIPPERRLLVTNHESLGYFASRYGFTIVGAIIPNVSSSASPSARDLARLVDALRAARAPAIFLDKGADPRLARQLADESGVSVVTQLFTESLSPADGPAPTYLEMMRFDTRTIVDALVAPGS
ncbi:MAG: metal ABC transporter substrate-binding protein [Chloroflexi bacterium]|nr:metal ABC transporter substrate-binding protein [Chloroflexota bacterium]